jgi:hypothetical protein
MLSANMKINLIGRNALNYNKGFDNDKLSVKPTCPCSQFIAY